MEKGIQEKEGRKEGKVRKICTLLYGNQNCDHCYNKHKTKRKQHKYTKNITSNAFNCLASHSIHITETDKSILSSKSEHEEQYPEDYCFSLLLVVFYCDGYTTQACWPTWSCFFPVKPLSNLAQEGPSSCPVEMYPGSPSRCS